MAKQLFNKAILSNERGHFVFDPTTPSAATFTFSSGITVLQSGLFHVRNLTRASTGEDLYYEYGELDSTFVSLVGQVLTLDISGIAGTVDTNDVITIFCDEEALAYDDSQDILKTIDQVRPVDTANDWLALADNLTGLAIGNTYYPIYWNSGHRNLDLTIDTFDTSTSITITAWITGNADASVTTDPDGDEDWKSFSNTLLGASSMDELSSTLYTTVNDLNPEIILIKVEVATAADGAVNIRYRTY